MLRLHCAADIPFCCLYIPCTISCPLTACNLCHILLSCFGTSQFHDSRNSCTEQHPFLHIPRLSFTWQHLLSLHLWKLVSPGHDFLCLTSWSHLQTTCIFPIYRKSPGKPSAHGPLITELLEALGSGFFIVSSSGWWSDCVTISCLELSYWHHSFPRRKAINFFLFPKEIICMCLLGVFWQMCLSVVLHHWYIAVEFQTSAVADPQNCNTAEMVLTWNCL